MKAATIREVDQDVSSQERSDNTLLHRYRSGDQDAASSLYLRYASRLRTLAHQHCTAAYAGRFDADDVVQSVFRTFFKGVRGKTYDVPPEGEIWALLMVLAMNKVRKLVEFHRADKRTIHQTASVPNLDAVLAADDSAAAFLRLVMDEQLAGLPKSNQTIVRLRIQGYEIGEIANHTGRSRRTVERALHDFRNRLAET